MPTSVSVHKKSDGTYDILVNGKLIHESVTEKGLKDQLAPYGVAEDLYQYASRQLLDKGEATLEIPIVKIWQV
jgi:hypothetical protein